MSLRKEIADYKTPKRPTTYDRILDAMTPADAKELESLMDDPLVGSRSIHRVLLARDFSISEQTLGLNRQRRRLAK